MSVFRPIYKPDFRSSSQEFLESDGVEITKISKENSGVAELYGAEDSVTTEVDIGTGLGITDITFGRSGITTTINGDVFFESLLSTNEFSFLLNKDKATASSAAFVFERATNEDVLMQFNNSNSRVEIGFFDTDTTGFSMPASLTSFADIKCEDMLVSVSIQSDSELTVGPTGNTSDLSFNSLNSTINLNDNSNLNLVDFTATSIFGGLIELKSSPTSPNKITNEYTNNSGGDIVIGDVVYIDGQNTVDLAIATSNNAASRPIGLVVNDLVADSSVATIATKGISSGRFESGLTLTDGDEVYLSVGSQGRLTNIQPSTSGQVIQPIGFVKNASGYDGISNLNAILHISRGLRTIL